LDWIAVMWSGLVFELSSYKQWCSLRSIVTARYSVLCT